MPPGRGNYPWDAFHEPIIVHVIPCDDLIEHDNEGEDCICGPRVEGVEGGGKVIVHHSLDGREASE